MRKKNFSNRTCNYNGTSTAVVAVPSYKNAAAAQAAEEETGAQTSDTFWSGTLLR